jgi:hypothetical protein
VAAADSVGQGDDGLAGLLVQTVGRHGRAAGDG